MSSWTFFVHGHPAPKGSLRPFQPGWRPGQTHRPQVVLVEEVQRSKPWMQAVTATARLNMPGITVTGPVRVNAKFFFPRPKAHYRTGQFSHLLRDDAPRWMDNTPDKDKLMRAVEDALVRAKVLVDDRKDCAGWQEKVYANAGEPIGCHLEIEELT
jgi:Holliday junction resolvase RusA-like endonuclease